MQLRFCGTFGGLARSLLQRRLSSHNWPERAVKSNSNRWRLAPTTRRRQRGFVIAQLSVFKLHGWRCLLHGSLTMCVTRGLRPLGCQTASGLPPVRTTLCIRLVELMNIKYAISAVLISAAFIANASDIDAIEARHQASIASNEGKTYEMKAAQAFFGDAAFMRKCAHPGVTTPETCSGQLILATSL